MAKDALKKALKLKPNTGIARNVVVFVGDGMGLSTINAARIYKGQKLGNMGEETELEFEKFPNVALSKVTHSTYLIVYALINVVKNTSSKKLCITKYYDIWFFVHQYIHSE